MTSGGVIRGLLSHFKCRNSDYPCKNGEKIIRFPVPNDKVSWEVQWLDYTPKYYTSHHLLGQKWADPELDSTGFHPAWNTLDGNINRNSYLGPYKIVNKFPLNPVGRTGLTGRGILGRWGPNHAADPIVTRWKRDKNHCLIYNENSKKPVLQFIGIKRKDCGEWAIPGGMVDPGEVISQTLRREFFEEALNYEEMQASEKSHISRYLNEFFQQGVETYRGYVDDARNTDNAWIETVAQNFHDENGTFLDKVKLKAGDDAKDVLWIDVSKELSLYASHSSLINLVVEKRNGHW